MTLPALDQNHRQVLIVLALFALLPLSLLYSHQKTSYYKKAARPPATEPAPTNREPRGCWGVAGKCDPSCEVVEFTPVLSYSEACQAVSEVSCKPKPDIYFEARALECDASGRGECYKPVTPLKTERLCPKLSYHDTSDPECLVYNGRQTCESGKDYFVTGRFSCRDYQRVGSDMQPCRWLGRTGLTHTACEENGLWMCVIKEGPGLNECSTAKDCVVSIISSPPTNLGVTISPTSIEKTWYKNTHVWIKATETTGQKKLTLLITDLPRNLKVIQCDQKPGEARCLIRGIPTVRPGTYSILAKVSLEDKGTQTFTIPFTVTR